VIKTDHLSLKHLLEQCLTHSLQHKGLSKLLEMEYVVQYKKGANNKAVDVLSRQIHNNSACVSMTITEILPKLVIVRMKKYCLNMLLICN
jgi:hypothetical protein